MMLAQEAKSYEVNDELKIHKKGVFILCKINKFKENLVDRSLLML
jgi:hypothetical protein